MHIACLDAEEVDNLKRYLSTQLEMKDLGEAKKILGMEIERDRETGTLILSQSSYLRTIVDKYGFSQVKLVQVPIAPQFKLSTGMSPKDGDEEFEMTNISYASLVGSLMYTTVCVGLI